MTDQVKIDENVIDDLVCGNLEGEQYRRVLRTLEAQPEHWRMCALTFLQEQALHQELSDLSKTDVDWGDFKRPATHKVQTVGASQSSAIDRSHSRLQWMHRFTSVAAMLMISFTIGWFVAGLKNENSPAATSNMNPSSENIASTQQSAEPVTTDQLLMGSGNVQFVGDDFARIDRTMPDWLRTLERNGRVEIDTVEVLMPMNLSDGSSAIVPVQQYRVKPVVYSY